MWNLVHCVTDSLVHHLNHSCFTNEFIKCMANYLTESGTKSKSSPERITGKHPSLTWIISNSNATMAVNTQFVNPTRLMANGLGPWRNSSAPTITGIGPGNKASTLHITTVLLTATEMVRNHKTLYTITCSTETTLIEETKRYSYATPLKLYMSRYLTHIQQ